jgi:hypothetical protein
MTRAVLSAAIDSDWRLVSQERPCPVCGAEDACSIHTADAFACCAREPSDWKLTNGSWLHKLRAQSGVIEAAQSGVIEAAGTRALADLSTVNNDNDIRL